MYYLQDEAYLVSKVIIDYKTVVKINYFSLSVLMYAFRVLFIHYVLVMC